MLGMTPDEYGRGGEGEGVGSSSSQETTIDSSLDLCKNFFADKK